jgi:sulfide:quinone oxidoreductase
MEYVKKYHIGLNFGETLVAVDGPAHKATFMQNLGRWQQRKSGA